MEIHFYKVEDFTRNIQQTLNYQSAWALKKCKRIYHYGVDTICKRDLLKSRQHLNNFNGKKSSYSMSEIIIIRFKEE